jgi:prepilin-type processing-associated H-X9-DG protein
LVVIAIIGVLAALLLPALSSAKRRANAAVCANSLRQIGIANAAFANEHQGWCVPLFYYPAPTGRWFWWNNPEFWRVCGMGNIAPAWDMNKWKLVCPEKHGTNGLDLSTFRNGWTGFGMNDPNLWVFTTDWAGWNLDRVVNPSTTVFMADSTSANIRWSNIADHGTRYTLWMAWGEDTTTFNYSRPAYRHNGGANCLFFDGHVEWRRHNTLAEDEMPAADWLPIWQPYPNPQVGLPTAPNYP